MNTQPPNQGAETPKSPEEVLKLVIQDLDSFRQNLTNQLSQDVYRLRVEKEQLNEDISKLRKQYEQLQSKQLESLSQRQIAQQQLWLKQLAQVLANNLQKQLGQKIRDLTESVDPGLQQAGIPGGELPMTNPSNNYYGTTNEFGDSLSGVVSGTFEALKQELDSYQSDLSVQLNSMRSMEQQGEVILEALVSRLQAQLENNHTVSSRTYEVSQSGSNNSANTTSSGKSMLTTSPVESSEVSPKSKTESTAKPKKSASQVQVGLILALLSAALLSLFNVCIKVILNTPPQPSTIFGLFPVEGLINPNVGNSLLILLLRLIVVMLLMPIVATFLYPAVWSDIERLIKSKDFSLWWKVIGSAFFLFLSQVLIYISIGNIPTAIAITIFFIYPIITVLVSWGLFGDRPSMIRIFAMVLIVIGGFLVLPSGEGDYQQGILAAVGAGITFSGYVILTQMSAGKLHPIPFSLVNFAGIFVFSALGLMMPLPTEWSVNINMDPSVNVWSGLIVSGIILGILTLSSYVLNSFAIRFAGAARASIIGTSGPALTALFALLVIGEVLLLKQLLGMLLVIIGVAAMSFERMFAARQKTS
ncbi:MULTISPECIES: EamA family transporter [Okeania]|uniref:EamA domain-containing protein n=1 Tax=Okeania hirsuta TaxID=1458930 RepID=A0A3N6NLX2_9CYAN|nr:MULTISPECIES: EamA family transporter [Okeania]NET14654.1 EamA family transporter [Okeania sp. SIO1H6]NES76027.1 EamA family transporter [Okeania sp. SIO1H4]NES88110.1 EamA family transporter [Okeania sp. SIO2B9]NET19519.1 EamA family transporter [Okeania sp. SIO1H5]NET76505.1 EamA family transporter [Okeania sp. SIO1F9]